MSGPKLRATWIAGESLTSVPIESFKLALYEMIGLGDSVEETLLLEIVVGEPVPGLPDWGTVEISLVGQWTLGFTRDEVEVNIVTIPPFDESLLWDEEPASTFPDVQWQHSGFFPGDRLATTADYDEARRAVEEEHSKRVVAKAFGAEVVEAWMNAHDTVPPHTRITDLP